MAQRTFLDKHFSFRVACLCLLFGGANATDAVSQEVSCQNANGAAMMQMASFDLRARAMESGLSLEQGVSAHRSVAKEAAHAQLLSAYNTFLQRKIAALAATEEPAVSELADLIGHFISHQSNSEDKCSSQLLEAKHQLNELHVVINDLASEINSTQTSIQVLSVELTTKREELEVVETWKSQELIKCEEIREERRKTLYTLKVEMTEMTHIAKPDVTMDIAGGSVTTGGVSLLEQTAPDKVSFSAAQALVTKTKTASDALKQCVEKMSRNPTGAPEESADKKCLEQKEYLEKIYVTTYVQITRLISEYEELIRSKSCESAVIQEYNVKVAPIRKVINELVIRIETLTTKLKELRPRLQDAYVAESRLREQIVSLTDECALLPETITDLDEVREAIVSLDKCPGLGAAEFNIPVWTKEWVRVRQSASESDAAFDASMNKACEEQFGDDGARSVRVAQVSEIYAGSIQDLPPVNSDDEAIVGACPLCAGASDADTGATHPDGHARVCWQPGVALDLAGASKECSVGERAVLCVYDRGVAALSSSSGSSGTSSSSSSSNSSSSSSSSYSSSSSSSIVSSSSTSST